MIKNENFLIKHMNKWIKTVDVFNLSLVLFLSILGILFVTSASPNIAKLKNIEEFHFIKKHYLYVCLAILSMIFFSLFSSSGIIKISFLGLFISLMLILIIFFLNYQNNGTYRWLRFGSFSIQPSEFLKPFIIIIFSYFLTLNKSFNIFSLNINSKRIAFFLFLIMSILLLAQPNFSMFMIMFCVFLSQYFIAGINLRWLIIISSCISIFCISAYFSLSHVKYRIDNFFSSDKTHYQIEKSLQAYQAGGILGKGPGEGTVKKSIPDSHTDFIFPVIAEEYGAIVCTLIVFIIFIIYFRGLYKVSKGQSLFKTTACVGLLTLFLIQALVNIAVSLKLIPTTGVTLPFISYGGSSIISMGIVMGMLLSLTKKELGRKNIIYGY